MFDVHSLIESGGILLIALIVFAESGLLVGFFLPGDTLLFGAGLAASQGELSIGWLILAIVIAAIVGDNVGYSIGERAGKRLFTKKDGILFRHEHIERAEKFYAKHGGKTIIIARFTPMVRTFAPVVAGAGNMPHRRFFMFNIVGGILWGAGMPLLGYWVGGRIPGLDKYIEVVLLSVVVISIGLASVHLLKDPKIRKALFQQIRDKIKPVRSRNK